MGKLVCEAVNYLCLTIFHLASADQINLNEPHPPQENSIEAFNVILPTIKKEILKSRAHWAKHEPRMWSRASKLSDAELTDFTIENDLVEVCINRPGGTPRLSTVGRVRGVLKSHVM